jgi:hypothetical protein
MAKGFHPRPDPAGRKRAKQQLEALSDDTLEDLLYKIDEIDTHDPDLASQCRGTVGQAEVHAQAIDNTVATELLFTWSPGTGKLVYLGISHDGHGCQHALNEAQQAVQSGPLT